MNAGELRIGNYIYDHNNEARQVAYVGDTIGLHNDIGGTQKYQHNPIFSRDINELKPIPLSEEWLLKFGFAVDDAYGVFIYMNKHDHDTDKISFRNSEGFVCYHVMQYRSLCKHIKYVHQLQNLFYSLTGEELKIKLL